MRPTTWALRKFAASRELRGGDAGRQVEQPVLDLAVLADEDGERPHRLQPDELDMLQPQVGLGGQDDAGAARQAGEKIARLGEERIHRPAVADEPDLLLDLVALGRREIADFEKGVDEEAQAELGRQPAGRDMRRIDQPERLEIAHHIADGGRRKRARQELRQHARTDRLAEIEIALDDQPEDLARAVVEDALARLGQVTDGDTQIGHDDWQGLVMAGV